jgi:hypothetical protein
MLGPRRMQAPEPSASSSSGPGRTERYAAVSPDPSGPGWREAIAFIRAQSLGPTPMPGAFHPRARFLWGLAQPLMGMRVMLRDRTLLAQALLPVGVLVILCFWGALFAGPHIESIGGFWTAVVWFSATFISLAPVPPFLFARHYARMAARSRTLLGLGPRDPYLEPISMSLGKTIAQMIIIAIGVAPVTVVIGVLPFGPPVAVLALLVQGVWTLHWMVVEALDNGRTLTPGDTVERVARAEAELRHDPWFHRWVHHVRHKTLALLATPFRVVAEIVRALGRSWSHEIRIVEGERVLTSGFALGVVVLLAVPGLNLFFRPALVIGAAHLRGRLES